MPGKGGEVSGGEVSYGRLVVRGVAGNCGARMKGSRVAACNLSGLRRLFPEAREAATVLMTTSVPGQVQHSLRINREKRLPGGLHRPQSESRHLSAIGPVTPRPTVINSVITVVKDQPLVLRRAREHGRCPASREPITS